MHYVTQYFIAICVITTAYAIQYTITLSAEVDNSGYDEFCTGITLDSNGNIYVVGQSYHNNAALVLSFNSSAVQYARDERYDSGNVTALSSVAWDSTSNRTYVVGVTQNVSNRTYFGCYYAQYDHGINISYSQNYTYNFTQAYWNAITTYNGNIYTIGYALKSYYGNPYASPSGDIIVNSYAPFNTHRWTKMLGSYDEDSGYAIAVKNSTTVAAAGYYSKYYWIGYFSMADGSILANHTFGNSSANSQANTILFTSYMVCVAGTTYTGSGPHNAAIVCKDAQTFADIYSWTSNCSTSCGATGFSYDSKGYFLITGNLNGTFEGVNSNASLAGFYLAVFGSSLNLISGNTVPDTNGGTSVLNPSNGKLYIAGYSNGYPNSCTVYTAVPIYCVNTNCSDNNMCTMDSCNPQTGCVNQAINYWLYQSKYYCPSSSTSPNLTSPSPSTGTSPTPSSSGSPSAIPSVSSSSTPNSVSSSPSTSATSSPSLSSTPSATPNDSNPNHSSGKNALYGIIAGLAGGFVLVVFGGIAGGVLLLKRNKRHKSDDEQPGKDVELVPSSTSEKPTQYTGSGGYAQTSSVILYRSDSTQYTTTQTQQSRGPITASPATPKKGWLIDFNEITIDKKIGSGAFGEVFKAKWRGIDVAGISDTIVVVTLPAVKKLISDQNATQTRDFFTEAEVMKNLKPHLNITQLYGVCESPLCIVTEFVANGTLLEKLQAHSLDDDAKIRIARGIAAGMMHLHSEGICRRDLASRNILLDSLLNPKVCDFGMSRVALDSQGNRTNNTVGPIRWMAPEALANQVYNTKTDVWSFGITLFEILTAKLPYANLDLMQTCGAVMTGSVSLLSEEEEEYLKPEILVMIMKQCLKRDPQERPEFSQIMTWFDVQS